MEKNFNCLFQVPYQSMVNRIKIAVRSRAATIEEFKMNRNGCIRIAMLPLSSLAGAWLDQGLSSFGVHPENKPDARMLEFPFKLFPEGSYTIQYVCEDGHTEPVNCYGYSALKIAYASWKCEFDKWVKEYSVSEELEAHEYQKQTQYFVAENGYSLDEGVSCSEILLDGKPFMRLFVAVSGAQTGEVDQECVLEGMRVGQDFLRDINSNIMYDLDGELNFTCVPDFVMM